ncbi:MAG: flagellar hook basal-body protein [Alphaproteobacteria bacterium]|nr:flagellar hook basal-body protein [Alphaproteobacteria bacterium]
MANLFDALRISESGARGAAVRQSAVADNVANAGTVGYRRVDVQFESLVDGHLARGTGVSARPRREVGERGPVVPTGVDGDMAVSGNGFFVVTDGQDRFLTRVGTFHPDADGILRNGNGFALLGWGAGGGGALAPLAVPPNVGGSAVASVRIAGDGKVSAILENGQSEPIGTVPLATVANPNGLDALTGTVFRATPASGDVAVQAPGSGAAGLLVSGALEASPVNLDEELVTQVVNQTSYAANLRALVTASRMTDKLLDIKS